MKRLDERRRIFRGLFLVLVRGLSFGASASELYFLGEPYDVGNPFDNIVTLANDGDSVYRVCGSSQ